MTGQLLIVEDDKDIRESLRDILSSEGFDVHVAGNGKQALELEISRFFEVNRSR